MTIDEAVRAIDKEPLPLLPAREGVPSPAEYLSFIGQIIQQTNASAWERKTDAGILGSIRQIGALAVQALEQNGTALGLQVVDREWIFEAAAPHNGADAPHSVTEFLLDIESIVLRYKAHRPQLRHPDAAPKVAANLIEIISLALAALMQHD
jgi:hypothetical protein